MNGAKGVTMTPAVHNCLDLPSRPSAVGAGRTYASCLLKKWEVHGDIADTALLIVSELLTNAVEHAKTDEPSGPSGCSLHIWLAESDITIGVHDQDPRLPVLRQANLYDEGGRGLLLVAEQSLAWGYGHLPTLPGKVVWARLSLLEEPTVSNEGEPQLQWGAPDYVTHTCATAVKG